MKIVVCIKQVPNVAALRIDPDSKTLVREKVPLEVSSYDIRALLKAVEIADEVVALTMGPPQARQALEHCLALGAHRAIHLCDPAFAGSDTLATARALAAALQRESFDLVLCGRTSVDAETGQVGPEVAEFLGLPQVTAARTLEVRGRIARIERETDEGFETVEAPLPLLITAAEDLAPERFPSRKEREAARGKPIETWTAADLALDASVLGRAGSPTQVTEIRVLEAKRKCRMVTVEELVGILREVEAGPPRAEPPAARPSADQDVWIVAEDLRPVTFELLGKASNLGRPSAVLLGHDVREMVGALAAGGAVRVYLGDAPLLHPYRTEPHATVLANAIRTYRPHSILLPSTARGRDLAPRVAARLGLGLTGDCIDLEMDGNGRLVQHKPAFGGNIVAPILSATFPQMATVRPGILRPREKDPSRTAEVVELPIADIDEGPVRVVSVRAEGIGDAADLDTAPVVVGFGMGIGGPENLPAIREFARAFNAPLATTRDCTDAGWISKHHQVGLTGKAIAPRLYFAVGIRGAFEHTVGIQKAGTVVAINKDETAWIWDAADYGVVGDWTEILPRIRNAWETATRRAP